MEENRKEVIEMISSVEFKLTPSRVFWLYGTFFIFAGLLNAYTFLHDEMTLWRMFVTMVDGYLVWLGLLNLYISVKLKHVKMKTKEEQLDEQLNAPLPKRW
jgi:hypothetical protein